MPTDAAMCKCGHSEMEHGQERGFYYTESRREVCLMCPGYEEPGCPRGKAWHRFKPTPISQPLGEQDE